MDSCQRGLTKYCTLCGVRADEVCNLVAAKLEEVADKEERTVSYILSKALTPPKLEWLISAVVDGRTISWTYDSASDVSRAWAHLCSTGRTHDTNDEITTAGITRPGGGISVLTRGLAGWLEVHAGLADEEWRSE